MRLYPPAWGFSRQALADDELGGFHLPRGWLAFVIPLCRCIGCPRSGRIRTRSIPSASLPERSADRPKFVYLPFGAGPRQCIGNQFALIEAQLIVATLAQRYRLHLVPGHRVNRGRSSRSSAVRHANDHRTGGRRRHRRFGVVAALFERTPATPQRANRPTPRARGRRASGSARPSAGRPC